MPIVKPRISLGVELPNPTFSIPGIEQSLAAGWSLTGATSYAGLYGASVPSPGHSRAQRVSRTNTGTAFLLSGPAVPYKLCNPASTKLCVVLYLKTSVTGSTNLRTWVRWYNSIGGQVGSDVQVGSITSAIAAWSVVVQELTTTPPANAHHMRLRLALECGAAAVLTLDIAFACIGCWNGSTASYIQLLRLPAHPGTYSIPTIERHRIVDIMGRTKDVDVTRYAQKYQTMLQFSGIENSMKLDLESAFTMNGGRSADISAATNPAGGKWPLILLPGSDAFLQAGLYDWADDTFPLFPAGRTFLDPPYWSGTCRFIERM